MNVGDAERRAAVIEELESLNLVRDHLTPTALLSTPALLDALGRGEQEEAFVRLCSLADQYSSDRRVAAAFACMGLSVHGRTVEDRMNTFSERLSDPKTSRTIRRWSELGREVLADLITEGHVVKDPMIYVRLYPDRLVLQGGGSRGEPGEVDLTELIVKMNRDVPVTKKQPDLYVYEPIPSIDSFELELLWTGETGVTFNYAIRGLSGMNVSAISFDRRWAVLGVQPEH